MADMRTPGTKHRHSPVCKLAVREETRSSLAEPAREAREGRGARGRSKGAEKTRGEERRGGDWTAEAEAWRNRSIDGDKRWVLASGRRGGGFRVGNAPPGGKLAPLSRVELQGSGRARGEALRAVGAAGSAPNPVAELPPAFPGSPPPRPGGTGNAGGTAISAHPPSPRVGEGKERGEEASGGRKDGDGSAHRRPGAEEGGERRVTNPPRQASGIGQMADATPSDGAGGPSRGRRASLSEGGSPQSALHRPRRRWGAAGNPGPPISESGEPAMPPTEGGGGAGGSAEGSPLRLLERSGVQKTPDRRGRKGTGEGGSLKFGSADPNFQAAHRRKRR